MLFYSCEIENDIAFAGNIMPEQEQALNRPGSAPGFSAVEKCGKCSPEAHHFAGVLLVKPVIFFLGILSSPFLSWFAFWFAAKDTEYRIRQFSSFEGGIGGFFNLPLGLTVFAFSHNC